MTTAATISARLEIDQTDFKNGLAQASKSADTFASKMKNIGSQMQNVGGAMTLGLTLPIVAFGTSSVNSAMEAESAMAELEAVIESTGGIAGVTAEQVDGLAKAFQKTTKFSDEAIMNGESMLLTFTNIGKDVFPQATEAMLNMAEKFGSIESASIQLGKALNDPIAGVTALRRVGVMLTDQQEQQIKDFMAVGDLASAQGIILKELEVEFGGLAEAAGATTSGSFEQFKNQLDDMKEIIGTALIPVLIRLMESITPLIEKFSQASPETQNWIIGLVALVAAAGPAISILGTLIPVLTAVGTAIMGISVPVLVIVAIVIAVLALLYAAWTNNWFGIQEKTAAVMEWLKSAFNSTVTFITNLWTVALEFWNNLMSGKLGVLSLAVSTALVNIKLIIGAFQAAMNGDWYRFGEMLRTVWDNVWRMMGIILSSAWTNIKLIFGNMVMSIVGLFKDTDWGGIGRNLVKGIASGISSSVSWIVDAARSAANAAMQAAKGFLGIHSPSSLAYAEIGMPVGEGQGLGWINGLEDMMPDVTRSMRNLFSSITVREMPSVINASSYSGLSVGSVEAGTTGVDNNPSFANNAQASASMGFDYYKLAAILAVEFAKVRD